ncbi:MAG: hypothetical protein WBP64_17150 [Nitrososphaeraceae archaeon]
MAGINFGGGDIQPIIQKDEIMAAKILVYAGEDGQYSTYISPEAYRASSEWMDFRRSCEIINV